MSLYSRISDFNSEGRNVPFIDEDIYMILKIMGSILVVMTIVYFLLKMLEIF